ncbi:MAG: hypothetical protein AVDCRST_MAG26-2937 [uncultured Chloroflexia bacterium]|uniref:Uncharacterized protein n=1 Tax=uncultured Chloroflexia bacterium TaxID=1672391 RepID=A0A6J4J9V1_9CHLR|nr:MAG: hypothetical protein AVDCRST_MAG26-2937 [uncultured Chloroflexia bacterium]
MSVDKFYVMWITTSVSRWRDGENDERWWIKEGIIFLVDIQWG